MSRKLLRCGTASSSPAPNSSYLRPELAEDRLEALDRSAAKDDVHVSLLIDLLHRRSFLVCAAPDNEDNDLLRPVVRRDVATAKRFEHDGELIVRESSAAPALRELLEDVLQQRRVLRVHVLDSLQTVAHAVQERLWGRGVVVEEEEGGQ